MRSHTTLFAAGLLSLSAYAAQAQTQSYDVLFATNSAALDSAALSTLDMAAQDYQRTGAASVMIEGHADTVGSAEYNRRLSERRADTVRTALSDRGVPASAMSVGAAGETDLAVQTGDNVAMLDNRRVTVNMVAPAPAPAPTPQTEIKKIEADTGLAFTIAPYGAINMEKGSDSYFAGVNLTADYAFTAHVVGSAEQAVFYEFGDGDEGIGGRSALGLDLMLRPDGLGPYIGGNVGYIYTDGQFGSEFFAGPEFGVKLDNNITAKVAYDMPFDRSIDNGVLSASIGYRF